MDDKDRKRKLELTGRMLKLIALFSMVLDHIGVVFVENGLMQVRQTAWGRCLRYADEVLRCAGRLAFPIYLFLLVEGFVHTCHCRDYGLRLFFFALLSEIPFDLAIFGKVFYPAYQNVMFTLLIAYLTLCAAEKFRNRPALLVLCSAAGCLAAEGFHTDYGAMGVVIAVLLYLYRGTKMQLVVGAVFFALESLGNYGVAALSVLFLRLYQKNEGNWPGKYFFYFAYPGHLLILALLYRMIFS